MRSKKWKEKEFSTATLTQGEVEEIISGSKGYDEGKAPVTRNTQQAAGLDDMTNLQNESHRRDSMSKTHNYGGFDAARAYDPDIERGNIHSESTSGDVIHSRGGDYPDDELHCGEDRPGDVLHSGKGDYLGDAAYDDGNHHDDNGYFGNESHPSGEVHDINIYGDEEIYSSIDDFDGDFDLQPLSPEDENYEDIMDNYEDITEKMASSPTKPKYWFKEQGDHWYCSCGQLNQGDRCVNCGLERDLLRALFFLHEPTGEPGNYEGMDIRYTQVDVPKGLSSRTKILIAIAAVVVLLAAAAAFAYVYVIKPEIEAEEEANAKAAAKSIETNLILCGDHMDSFIRGSYITAGDECCDKGKFTDAIELYRLARDIKGGDGLKSKINKAKYGYVTANKANGGDRFEKYLNSLHEIGYPGIDDIYKEYYAWHFKIVANLDENDYKTDIETAGRKDIIYFHVSVSGGAPDETIDVYYKAVYPGKKHQETDVLGKGWKSGSKGAARCLYAVPILGKEGKLTFTIYNKDTNEELGSDSIMLKK